jgi:ribosomal protein S18 acetylase RimI-like enzyme
MTLTGTAAPVADVAERARLLAGLGWLPEAEVELLQVRLDGLEGRAELLQERSAAERVRLLEALWARGLDGDARAIDAVLAANPDTPPPAFLRIAPPFTLSCALEPSDVAAAVALLSPEYWNDVFSRERIAGALTGSTVWVGARDDAGRLVACARAISDGHKYAWVYDVVVAPAFRGRGLGQAVMRLCLEHPRIRGAARVLLQTRDAQPLYRKFGFIEEAEAPPRPYRSTGMLRIQR